VRLDPPAAARLGAFLMASLGAAAESSGPVVARATESWADRWQWLRDGWLARLTR
jgi:hypothetical protein